VIEEQRYGGRILFLDSGRNDPAHCIDSVGLVAEIRKHLSICVKAMICDGVSIL
jgi:hypothetical protein